MKHIKHAALFILSTLLLAIIAASCNMPAGEMDEATQQTVVAQTVEAALPSPTNTSAVSSTATTAPTQQKTTDATSAAPTNTQSAQATSTQTEDGVDDVTFLTDITLPDYSEVEVGEKVTKTWRLQNTGTTTWTTDYQVVFVKEERLGAPASINLPKEVAPDETVDISIDFTIPEATGEYRSDWILETPTGKQFGLGEDDDLTFYVIVTAVKEGEAGDGEDGEDSEGGIAGGAKVTNATVKVDDANYSGSCPANITFTYTVTTSEDGKVNFQLRFTPVSPSGYSFDPAPEYSTDFTSGYTVTYTYTFIPNSSVTGRAKVVAVGSNTFTSDSVQFSVKCTD